MTSAAHPGRLFLFCSTLHSLLLFKLSLALSFLCQISLTMKFLSCPLHSRSRMCTHIQYENFMKYRHDTYSCVMCVCLVGCYRTTSWRDFLMMLLGTYPTSCPCESPSYTHCTHLLIQQWMKHWPPTHFTNNHNAGIGALLTNDRPYPNGGCNSCALSAAVLLNGRSHSLIVSVQCMVASGSHEGNSRHCRPARASPMSCETTPFSISSPSLPPLLLLPCSSPTTHTAIPLANESVWWPNCLICRVSVCVCQCACVCVHVWTTSSAIAHRYPTLRTLPSTCTPRLHFPNY